ncbi:MAG: hypothetical protein NWF05_05220 [Candidatus Bathyarchaeota archaeon]|nr:hypothetical protein [Candidatus Bathyarchaeota archaeon]
MEPFHEHLGEYRKQLAKGTVRAAYQGLMEYFGDLRVYLKKKYPDYFLSGNVHFGQMDYTYFYFFPKALKRQNLKIAILFIHDTFTVQVLLAGYNKDTQAKYWKLLKENGWNKHHLAPNPKEGDTITDSILVDKPDFSNPHALTNQIENGTLKFIKDIQNFLTEHKN